MTSPIPSSSTSSVPVSTAATVASSDCPTESTSVTASVTASATASVTPSTMASVLTSPSSASPVVTTSVASSVFVTDPSSAVPSASVVTTSAASSVFMTDSSSGMPSLFASFTPSVSSNTASTPLSSPGSASTSNVAASNSSIDISVLFSSQLNIGAQTVQRPRTSSMVSLFMHPEQLKFSIGESPSKSPGKGFNFLKSPTTPTASAAAGNASNTGLFGSSIVAEATRAPTRFKFGSTSGSPSAAGPAPSTSAPAGRKVAGQRDSEAANTQQTAGTSSESAPNAPYIPSLGKDITVKIRSVPSNPANKPCPLHATLKPDHHKSSLTDAEVLKLLSGYRSLKEELNELKAEVAASHTTMKELMSMFTSEAAKINVRLTTLEWKYRKQNPHDRTDDAINFVLENLGLNKDHKNE